jgi:phenylalanyl-tRNA synthetase beta chain
MKVPMSWLNDYTDISDITPKEYAHMLTMTGSMVEGIEDMGKELQNVVTGRIVSIKPHEDSDHLQICQIDVGDETIQIVTGAQNVKEGQIVPVAKHNSHLAGGVTIKKGKLRGVESNGMLCSHEELGLTPADLGYEPEYGILILPEETAVGIDIKEVFGLNEQVIDFDITSNRPDCFCAIGLARETAASFDRTFAVKQPEYHENSEDIKDTVSVEVKDTEKCLRYSAKMVKNVKIGPSPAWMVQRLRACGVRSINNIVDITNYVLLEYGQPMHAFDLRDLAGQKIVVRRAQDGEVIKTLDEVDRTLDENTLVISDAEKAVAIAGVMGGFNSEVKPDTQTVVFESATFDAASVRIAAQKAGLRTEASSRYEKGLDANNTVPALERACELVELLGAGEVVGGMIDVVGQEKQPVTLTFRPENINVFLGTDIPAADMKEYLERLEFVVDMEQMTVTAPSFRPDIEAEADVAEEIARMYGYNKIPVTLLSGEATKGRKTDKQQAQDSILRILTAQGYNEICSYTFASPSVFDKLNIPKDSDLRSTVKISNPLGEDTSIMRTTTLGSMMDILAYNYNHRNEAAKLFEIGKVYLPNNEAELPDEPEVISMGMYGAGDFYDLKGACEALFAQMHVKNVTYRALTDNPTFHPGRTAEILIGGERVGVLGELHPSVSEHYGIGTKCYAAEIQLEKLLSGRAKEIKYTQLPKFPAVSRDIAMLVDKGAAVAEIEDVMTKAAGKLLDTIKLFDVYEGEQIPEGKKSVAYAVSFRAPDRTLTDEEVNKVFDKMLKRLEENVGAQLR